MEFNSRVKTQLLPLLQNYGFEIKEEFNNIVRFESSKMKLNLVFNDYDKTHLVEIGRKGEILYPLNDITVKKAFNSTMLIEKVTLDIFIKNLTSLFQTNEGIKILKGDMFNVKKSILQESEGYTLMLSERQLLESALKAWKEEEYSLFVQYVNEIGLEKLPQSYHHRYRIAVQKSQNF